MRWFFTGSKTLGSGGAAPGDGYNIAGQVVGGGCVVPGFTQALLGAAPASATFHAHTQGFTQILHGLGAAITHGGMDLPLGNSLTDAYVHGGVSNKNRNEIYSCLKESFCQAGWRRVRY
jgi:hypothetical protein